jgi:chromosome segregation ATPase
MQQLLKRKISNFKQWRVY